MFKFKHGYFTNIKNGKVVSVKDRKDVEGQPVHAENRIGGNHPSQRWRISYLHIKDKREEYTKKGSMSRRGFGFLANMPFYLRSKLPMQRVAECVGANNVVLKKWANGRKAQQW
jgi:hypothetical protein